MRIQRGSRAEIVSTATDDDFLGVGTSPSLGDIGATGVPVPATHTDPEERYLIRLCGFNVPGGYRARVTGIRQLVTLRAEVIIENESPPSLDEQLPIEIEQTSPLWTFPDGNISWHLVHYPNSIYPGADNGPMPGPNQSGDLNALTSAILVVSGGTVATGLIPPGNPAAYLGTWRDLRYPWTNTQWTLDARITGPGLVVFYASVKQTNPVTRPIRRSPLDLGAIRQEDRFLLEYPESARYGRVAGALTVEFDGGPT